MLLLFKPIYPRGGTLNRGDRSKVFEFFAVSPENRTGPCGGSRKANQLLMIIFLDLRCTAVLWFTAMPMIELYCPSDGLFEDTVDYL